MGSGCSSLSAKQLQAVRRTHDITFVACLVLTGWRPEVQILRPSLLIPTAVTPAAPLLAHCRYPLPPPSFHNASFLLLKPLLFHFPPISSPHLCLPPVLLLLQRHTSESLPLFRGHPSVMQWHVEESYRIMF